ncbi:hypothetical protein M0534_10620 [Methylonatrum kenyense]|uniref:hypothetical protein n=1 Tax=Methylonatrum kenyense TaxID=455253 RepID=UPI0020BF7E1B|nr:hypothetical protein [Methylonatrum kenyense]MCK8516769.1 hypothetical protein [Methylonatrum kenyense]
MAMQRIATYLLPALLVLIVPLFFIDLEGLTGGPGPPQELSAIAHVAFFALAAAWCLSRMRSPRPPGRILAILAGLFLLGASIEGLQALTGRQPSIDDLLLNGIGLVVGACTQLKHRRLLLPLLALPLASASLYLPITGLWDRVGARLSFPVLADFNHAFEHRRWTQGDIRTGPDGKPMLHVDLTPGRYAGTTLKRSLGNWNDTHCLHLVLRNPADTALPLTVSIRDHEHWQRGGNYQDRYNLHTTLEPGRNELRIPTENIRTAPRERHLDLARIDELALFTTNLGEQRQLIVDTVFLSSRDHRYHCF